MGLISVNIMGPNHLSFCLSITLHCCLLYHVLVLLSWKSSFILSHHYLTLLFIIVYWLTLMWILCDRWRVWWGWWRVNMSVHLTLVTRVNSPCSNSLRSYLPFSLVTYNKISQNLCIWPKRVTGGVLQVVQETIDPNAKIEFRPNTEDDPHKRKPDITKAKELLGWEPKVALRQGLPLMVKDFRQRVFGDQKQDSSTTSSTE